VEHALRNEHRPYLPAAGHDRALPLYDPFMKLFGGDKVRTILIGQAALQGNDRVLDVGSGTGTLAVQIKRLYPSVEVVGIDPDPKSLARSRQKAEKARVTVQFDQGYAHELPYADGSFIRVFSSFMFHHLPAEHRGSALRDILRVLRPGGSLHLLDFAGADSHGHSLFAHLFHESERLKDNTDARILALMKEAGFERAAKVKDGSLFWGLLSIAYYEARSAGR
jgi:ubiquinone/menaquinone biosynthesis C-methylase UbiE